MNLPIDEQVIEFYDVLFGHIFSQPFRIQITQRLRRNAVLRQVAEAADAASQSLTRFFLNSQLSEQQVADILDSFSTLGDLLELQDIANPNVTPESVATKLRADIICPDSLRVSRQDAIYRHALYSVLQVLMRVGPVMAEWQRLNFSSTFELPQRVVNRLNQISEQMDALGQSGQAAADERYELTYRDYLLQRFFRVEAGTVRMTTNLEVDLRELFVMPRVLTRAQTARENGDDADDVGDLMNLSAAREFFERRSNSSEPTQEDDEKGEGERGTPALAQVKHNPYNVIIGAPGSGKSTFLEWLQVQVAAVEEEFVMAEQQAIPLLLRVRQLDSLNLPDGDALVAAATASADIAALMPPGWVGRQMTAGRVLFMLDGLDEAEPELRDAYIIPWLLRLYRTYSRCGFLVSSRPVGYPPRMLRHTRFAECDLLDFDEGQIGEYTRHWCTAVRLARNEPEDEARREGANDGDNITQGFQDNPYIRDLARNPLMLSAICLVYYYEGGRLPDDRAVLYRLCVEGLLHNWDLRRGIQSEFPFDEKMRVCREVALAMQADDRAEYETEKIRAIFENVLGDGDRAARLLEHVRYRTGLLVERRPDVFAFAHLTFQEYLAARAVHEGNRLGYDPERLVREHNDARWLEVIPLYCGLAPTPMAHSLIEKLIAEKDTESLASILAEAYLASGPELGQDGDLRQKTLERIAVAPGLGPFVLERFPDDEITPLANKFVGKIKSYFAPSNSYWWLYKNPSTINMTSLMCRIRQWHTLHPVGLSELVVLAHSHADDNILVKLAQDATLYDTSGPEFLHRVAYDSQAEVALFGLSERLHRKSPIASGFEATLLEILKIMVKSKGELPTPAVHAIVWTWGKSSPIRDWMPQDTSILSEFAQLSRRLVNRLGTQSASGRNRDAISVLNAWADSLERAIAERARQEPQKKSCR